MKTKILIICALLLLPFAMSEELGEQVFHDIDFTDEFTTPAEEDIVQTSFEEVDVLPTSLAYEFKRFVEFMQYSFARTDEEKAGLHILFAQARLAEARAMLKHNQTEEAEQVLEDYGEQVQGLENILCQNDLDSQAIQMLDQDIGLTEQMAEEVLEESNFQHSSIDLEDTDLTSECLG